MTRPVHIVHSEGEAELVAQIRAECVVLNLSPSIHYNIFTDADITRYALRFLLANLPEAFEETE